MIIKVEPRDGPSRSWWFRLLFDRNGTTRRLEFHHAIAFRIADKIGKDSGAARTRAGLRQNIGQSVSEKDVIAEYQGGSRVTHVLGSNDVGLSETLGLGLGCIGDIKPPLRATAEQLLKVAEILRGRDNQDLADSGEHER